MRSFKTFVDDLREDSGAALQYAIKAHKGQFRSDGTEYVKHPERVASFVQKF